jgi:hypothetical protein
MQNFVENEILKPWAKDKLLACGYQNRIANNIYRFYFHLCKRYVKYGYHDEIYIRTNRTRYAIFIECNEDEKKNSYKGALRKNQFYERFNEMAKAGLCKAIADTDDVVLIINKDALRQIDTKEYNELYIAGGKNEARKIKLAEKRKEKKEAKPKNIAKKKSELDSSEKSLEQINGKNIDAELDAQLQRAMML